MSTAPEVQERGLVAWFTRNTVAANLLMWLIVVAGLLVLPVLKKEVFPEMSAQRISVSVAYPGATPAEVEEAVCRRVEEAVQGLAGVEKILSTAAENGGMVMVELLPGIDPSDVVTDVRGRIDGIDTFPDAVETPIVQEVVVRRQVLNIAVAGDADERTLKRVAERVRDDLLRHPDITQIELVNVRPDEISIEVSEAALRRHGLSFDQVAAAVRASSLDLPGGSLRTRGGEILLRTKGQAYHGADFEQLPLITRADGTRLLLGQVAQVRDGFAQVDQAARFDGKPSALLQLFRVGDQSALAIAAAATETIERIQPELPAGISLTPWRDQTRILKSRIALLARNAGTGLLLVFCVLALFLRFKLAFWVSLGIPISFLGAIALMPTFGVSVNMVSLFAFILVLGIVVDDAIVVGESVYNRLQAGDSGVSAAIRGAKVVALPVVFGVMTTIVAFTPLLDVDTNARELWRHVPLIVIPCLLFSLVESKLILPAHLSHERAVGDDVARHGVRRLLALPGRAWAVVQVPFTRAMDAFIRRVHHPFLELCLRWRYVTWATGIAVLGLTLTLVGSGWIRFQFFPAVEGDNVIASLRLPLGTSAQTTATILQRLERAAEQIDADLERELGSRVIQHMLTSIGQQPHQLEMAQNAGSMEGGDDGAHLGEVNLQLSSSEERTLSAEDVLKRWRDAVGGVPEAEALSFTSSIVPGGSGIDIQLSAPDIATLRAATDELAEHLRGYAGVAEVSDSLTTGKQELRVELLPRAETLGLSLADIARQVRQGFYGEEAQRVQRGREDVKVMVRYPEHERRALDDFERMRIRTADGSAIPLATVARVVPQRGYAKIERTDMARTVNLTAAVDPIRGNANQILAELETNVVPGLRAEHPNLVVTFEGNARDQARTLDSLVRGGLVALFAIYALMAIPFGSYLQPLIVMLAIPFGLVGAIWGHVFMGMDLSIVSMLGLVALAGVVVNDSLVLVDFINRRRAGGMDHLEAVHRAGVARFRPILLTSLTTFASLTPMLMERSVQAKFLMPMAVSLAFGVLFSTLISLVLVPSGYLILEDLRRGWRWLFPAAQPLPAQVPRPAPEPV